MKTNPMLFKGEMVRALLAGQKTQTRRIVKSRTGSFNVNSFADGTFYEVEATDAHGNSGKKIRPVSVGDVIWVRETWLELESLHRMVSPYAYRADTDNEGEEIRQEYIKAGYLYQWKPSLYMPYAACRIWLKVIGVRAERLLDISEADAIAEGIEQVDEIQGHPLWRDYSRKIGGCFNSVVNSYQSLWEAINGEASWDANPFVWVYTFELTTKPR